jgi:hypothetical protein
MTEIVGTFLARVFLQLFEAELTATVGLERTQGQLDRRNGH